MADALGGHGDEHEEKRRRTSEPTPDVSVLVPCKNALPWLPLAVRAALLQHDLLAEVLVVDDWSTDGSGEWLDALAAALGSARARVERMAGAQPAEHNLAVVIPRRPTAATPNFGADAHAPAPAPPADAPAHEPAQPLAACDVAAEVLASESRCRLRVLSNRGHGQGAALQTALDASTADLIAHIEADDEFGPRRLALMRGALKASGGADAVFSVTRLIGTNVTAGMTSYVRWQNGLRDADELAAGRFIELPALHQVGMYTRASLDACAAHMPGAAAPERMLVYRELREWPVDYDFALRWYETGARAFRLDDADAAYEWRQHGSNGTRWQGRCSLDSLRACKASYFARALRDARAPARVQLWSVGRTLDAWAAALVAEGVEVIERFEWNPKQPPPAALGVGANARGGGGRGRAPVARGADSDGAHRAAASQRPTGAGAAGAKSAVPADAGTAGAVQRAYVRLFVYGAAPVRERVSRVLEDTWDSGRDFFAA